jgi:hypothetical protein
MIGARPDGGSMQGHFQVDVKLGNAAMNDLTDIAEALTGVVLKLDRGQEDGAVVDANGNTVGRFGTPTRKTWARVHEDGYRAGQQEILRELARICRVDEADEDGMVPGSGADVAQGVYALLHRHGMMSG